MKPKGDTFFRALLLGLRAFVSLDDVASFVWWVQRGSVVAFSTGGSVLMGELSVLAARGLLRYLVVVIWYAYFKLLFL